MKKIILICLLSVISVSASARSLNCEVSTDSSGELRQCGSFKWQLPQDHSYGNGTGVCSGLLLWTTMTKDGVKPGHDFAFWLTALADKDELDQNGGNVGGHATVKFQGDFPKYFQMNVSSPKGLNHRISCQVEG